MDRAIIGFSLLAVLLVLGKAVRMRSTLLQRLYLPSAVVGGLIGLAFFSVFRQFAAPAAVAWLDECLGVIRQVPGVLISVIFATLFLGARIPRLGETFRLALPQLALAQIVAWGQYVVGVGLAGFLLAPAFKVPAAFGNLLEMGFEGGHGTIGGAAASFTAFGWEDGIALGYTVATVGMILGVVVGMALVNCAYRRGYVKSLMPFAARSRNERLGVHLRRARPGAGVQTVCSDSVDSLAWHLAVAGIAVAIGYLALKGLQFGEAMMFPREGSRLFKGFPLFPLCMIGSIVLQGVAGRLKLELFVDRGQMERISGAALDFLSLSAVATIQIQVIAANWIPLTIMMAAGLVWTALAVMKLSPKLFSEAWFERGITEFGQATGVTATGLLLLRTVDPDNRTPAAASFACKQLFHEPIMGFWLALALALVFTVGWVPVFLVSLAVVLFWSAVAFAIIRRRRR